MRQSTRDTLEAFVAAGLAGLLCWAAVFLAPSHHLGAHVYHAANTGVVAWDCGPGFELGPATGFFWESEC